MKIITQIIAQIISSLALLIVAKLNNFEFAAILGIGWIIGLIVILGYENTN